ncbi:hypothetical protein [uncultured Psychroserpens sp.]|uniref:hypothetical protein n=1 Tax=uncultured Psychroserpens sp. TaxID=255436 RepID=UPI00261F6373|nr:hypothetical protein [uncultured Psychroserpens sp.]
MIKKIVVIVMVCLVFSCEQLIEVEDISNEMIHILAPSNNLVIENTAINFSWQPLDFADEYQLQIASPNFDNATEIVEDTLVSNTNFSKTLSVGHYQWRIKAINFAYETAFTTQNLTIEE